MDGSAAEYAYPAWPLLAAGAAGAGAVTLAVASLARALARRFDLLDRPNARSSHVAPTPRLGGLGILAAVGFGIGLARWGGLMPAADAQRLAIVGGVSIAIGAISLVDDLRGLPSAVRLTAHLAGAAAMIAWLGGLSALSMPWGGTVALGVLGVPLTMLWITFFTNAFNFMDGIDGIAGVQAGVAGLGWAALGVALGEPGLAWIGALVAGAAVGFLLLNWPPAGIFMGDVGSALLGTLLAALPLAARRPDAVALAAVLLVAPFVFDAAFTLARRARRGENVFQAHRSHLYQRLTAAGWPVARVDLVYAVLAACGAAAAWLAGRSAPGAAPAIVLLAAALAGLWALVVRAERRTRTDGAGELGGRRLA